MSRPRPGVPLPVLLALCVLAAPAGAAPGDKLTVSWREKPPAQYIEDGVEKGFLLQRAKDVFAAAGIPAHFVMEPPKRIWVNLKANAPNYCSLGWYRLPEREQITQYSHPLHVDPPHIILVAPGSVSQVARHSTLASLLADQSLVLGLVDGLSYGPDLDGMIKRSTTQLATRTVAPTAMMRMVAAGRVSFMFLDREDYDYLITREPSLKQSVRRELPDMPPGLARHVVCSRAVPAATMDKLNAAIDANQKARAASAK